MGQTASKVSGAAQVVADTTKVLATAAKDAVCLAEGVAPFLVGATAAVAAAAVASPIIAAVAAVASAYVPSNRCTRYLRAHARTRWPAHVPASRCLQAFSFPEHMFERPDDVRAHSHVRFPRRYATKQMYDQAKGGVNRGLGHQAAQVHQVCGRPPWRASGLWYTHDCL